ncbi:MAG: SH3 domain-containing protein [Flavobacteriales bacterium]|nr:SH3 domain-containing protein [Flavobacteriales bacterium]
MKKLLVILISLVGLQTTAQNTPKHLNVMAVNGLNMRSQPDGHSRVVTKVPFGKQVEILEQTDVELQLGWITDHWYKVRFRGREGFIFGGYLSSLPAPLAVQVSSLSEVLPAYCKDVLTQEGDAVAATERTRTGDTLFYSMMKFAEGVELESESQSERTTSKLLLPVNVQQSYVLLEALLKSSGNTPLLDQLRFVKGADGKLTRISIADGSISVKAVSDELTELTFTSFADQVSAQR